MMIRTFITGLPTRQPAKPDMTLDGFDPGLSAVWSVVKLLSYNLGDDIFHKYKVNNETRHLRFPQQSNGFVY